MEIVRSLGAALGTSQHMGLRDHRVMLGVLVRLGAFQEAATLAYEPRPENLNKLRSRAAQILHTGLCTPAEASKLRRLAG